MELKIISFLLRKQGDDGAVYYRYGSKTIEDLKGFNYDGYQFDANLQKEII
jgi:hypothetical protein